MNPPGEDDCDVILLGSEGQENLGLRSVAAYLENAEVRVEIEPLEDFDKERILAAVRRRNPRVVGFSLIFQRMLDSFVDLIGYLRAHGVGAHFTIGGHYPTFEYEDMLRSIPGLDSVVRQEGELTLLELFEKIDRPEAWSEILGLAYRHDGEVRVNPPRPLIGDLDSLPFPVRKRDGATHRGIGIRSLAASRGCYYDCTFCSIHEFYRRAPGPNRRARSPEHVLREMEELFDQHGVRIFIFQDDDLFMRGHRHRRWLEAFLDGLEERTLGDEILWRVSCRIDDIGQELLARMKANGLAGLYIGVEAGSDQALKTFNKRYRVEDVHRALAILERLEVPFEFGFMIFDPDSTVETVRENIEFLKQISSDGRALANFCKMSPYAGTPIARRLKAEGRLLGTAACPEYRFLDPRLDFLQLFYSQTFNFRNFDDRGLVERLRFAKFDTAVVAKFLAQSYEAPAYAEAVRRLIQECNESALETISLATRFIETHDETQILVNWDFFQGLAGQELVTEQRLGAQLDRLMLDFGFEASGSLRGYTPASVSTSLSELLIS